MIYISSSCIKNSKIADCVEELAVNNFLNIELSGGTKFYDGLIEDLLELKMKFNLNYLVHNYFPPPVNSFVFNLSSLDKEIEKRSISHALNAIKNASILGSKKIGFHAGFLINIPVNKIGGKINRQKLFNKPLAINKFIENYHILKSVADKLNISIYIENNVLSFENLKTFQENPFLFVESSELQFFNENLNDFKYIFDYAHSYVSSKSLGLNVENEFDNFTINTDYIHLSDNNGKSDTNFNIFNNSPIYNHLVNHPPINKTITLEVYAEMSQIKRTYEWLNKLVL